METVIPAAAKASSSQTTGGGARGFVCCCCCPGPSGVRGEEPRTPAGRAARKATHAPRAGGRREAGAGGSLRASAPEAVTPSAPTGRAVSPSRRKHRPCRPGGREPWGGRFWHRFAEDGRADGRTEDKVPERRPDRLHQHKPRRPGPPGPPGSGSVVLVPDPQASQCGRGREGGGRPGRCARRDGPSGGRNPGSA